MTLDLPTEPLLLDRADEVVRADVRRPTVKNSAYAASAEKPIQAGDDFWYGHRVLVTGRRGFLATHLINSLVKQNANVVGALRHLSPMYAAELLGSESLAPDVEYGTDLSNFDQVLRFFNRHLFDTVFHLAASPIVSDAANAPMATIVNNVLPTLNILEAARITNTPRVIIASSDKAYGDHAAAHDPERLPYVEDSALRGLDVYSASKVCADMISQTYALQFKMGVVVVRCCNIYGPGDLNFTRLIPRTILRLLHDQAPIIHKGNAKVLREYMYVDDVVRAYELLAKNLHSSPARALPRPGRAAYGWCAYNVGSYRAEELSRVSRTSNPNIRKSEEVIQLIKSKLGKADIDTTERRKNEEFVEIPDQYVDATKIISLGFRSEIQIEEGLDQTINWYRKHAHYLSKIGHRYLQG
jgi:CDP-glucose 4,6-dehydratase